MKNATVSTDQSCVHKCRHCSPQWVLFLPDWATAQTGKRGCTGVHPVDITKGKQDTAGQKSLPQPMSMRRTSLYEESWLSYSELFLTRCLKCIIIHYMCQSCYTFIIRNRKILLEADYNMISTALRYLHSHKQI